MGEDVIVVDLWGVDGSAGSITWDGRKLLADSKTGRWLIEDFTANVGQEWDEGGDLVDAGIRMTAAEAPELWLRSLPDNLHGSNLFASLRD